MTAVAYAARRPTERVLRQPRNIDAAQQAREKNLPVVVSFVGEAGFRNPTIFCDSGRRYDWSALAGLQAIVVVKPGVDTKDALEAILARSDVIGVGYPVLVDQDSQEVACVVHGVNGQRVGLWQIKRGTELWRQYFAP